MSRLAIGLVLLSMVSAGCSQETRTKTDEALEKTGSAVESAAEDAAKVTKGAVEGASKAVQENSID